MSCAGGIGTEGSGSTDARKYRASLDAWVASAGSEEKPARESARERIVAWQEAGRAEDPLDLSLENPYDDRPASRLTKLPPLPPGLQGLSAAGHRLKKLPSDLPGSLAQLDVRYNGIRKLPSRLPASLTRLNVGYNELESLPSRLPASLVELDVSYNKLRSLPPGLPASLQELNASGNRLRGLPARLPASLVTLNVSLNGHLENLPDNLPDSLTRLDAFLCAIAEVPASVLAAAARRASACEVNLAANPLSGNAREQIEEHNERVDSGGAGRQIQTMMEPDDADAAVGGLNQYGVGRRSETLEGAVEAWYDAPDPARQEAWKNLHQEAQSDTDGDLTVHFWALLDSLRDFAGHAGTERDVPETSTAPGTRAVFRNRMTALLDAVAQDKELRETCFAIAFDASRHCHDRVALRFDQMEQAHLALRAGRGEFTQEKVFELGLGTFKLNMLDETAKAQARTMKIPKEELEVILYYRTKLAAKLGLPHQTEVMLNERFVLEAAQAADKDIEVAEAGEKVQKAARDPMRIVKFLAEWAPWQKTLERLHPAAFDVEAVEVKKDEIREHLDALWLGYSDRAPDAKEKEARMKALQEKYNDVEADLFRAPRERLTEAFLLTNTALWNSPV